MICAVGFLPHENNFRKGGEGKKIAFTRCGGMAIAKKDSWRQVYSKDGSYTYPHIPGNLIRAKGSEYFQNREVTGSREQDKDGNLKFPLTV